LPYLNHEEKYAYGWLKKREATFFEKASAKALASFSLLEQNFIMSELNLFSQRQLSLPETDISLP